MDAEEIKEEIAHQRDLQKEYRKRLRVLEKQAAGFGNLHVPAHIQTEINALNEDIYNCERAINGYKHILISSELRQRENPNINAKYIFIAVIAIIFFAAVLNGRTDLPSESAAGINSSNTKKNTDISGKWVGEYTSSELFHFELQLFQTERAIEGSSTSWRQSDRSDMVVAKLRGTFSNGVLRFDEYDFVSRSPRQSECLLSGELQFSSPNGVDYLKGKSIPNESPGCSFEVDIVLHR